jgi:hypothetical protein
MPKSSEPLQVQQDLVKLLEPLIPLGLNARRAKPKDEETKRRSPLNPNRVSGESKRILEIGDCLCFDLPNKRD